jgi:hypothetical protein
MRFCFCSGINIQPYNGATAAIFIAQAPQKLDPFRLYHSDITPFGKTWVKRLDVKYDDVEHVVVQMDKLVEKMRRKFP